MLRQGDERGAADIAAVWPGDRGADMLRCGLLYQCYCVEVRIDVINKIDGVNYADAAPRAVAREIDGVPVRIIAIEDLIANKRASGRTKDLADAEILEGLRK